MRSFFLFLIIVVCIVGCNANKPTVAQNNTIQETTTTENDTVRIENDSLEYQIIIIEPGFNTWLVSTARPEGYYEQQYLESRNIIMVNEWNNRVITPTRFDPNLYEIQIDYRPNIDYGYEVNYKLYNYFIYFQLKYNQRLSSFVPRI
ncbi:DUF6146 family protein [Formosa sp. A9]|uniref:DUF6146 family protein n=1 Tax=Formosa sp. A9 TaxID=3442641 RepID=UPI003EB8F3B1